ncbi:MAG: NADH:flavin oxidoreductase [Candidatus Tokpelaia sp. JSC189]|nr:MAG: NADH:flavin oxidoreductase [Candidatus Tokpelaia sp. JSC189]
MSSVMPSIFDPFSFINGLNLRNRLVMAPMTTWSSNADGTISDQEVAWYHARVKDIGMVITGCTHVMANGVGFTGEFAANDDSFIPSLKRLAKAAKSGGAPAILQIFHAGNKSIPGLIPDGRVVSSSGLKARPGLFNDGKVAGHAMTEWEIGRVIHAFGEAAYRAIEAGFDGVELHAAYGFLIQNFLSPFFNRRNDAWGGSLENRIRFPLAVVNEIQKVIKAHARKSFIFGYRISPEEHGEGTLRIHETCVLVDRLIEAGIDYINIMSDDIRNERPQDSIGDKTNLEFMVEHIDSRVPLIATGGITTPEDAREVLEIGLSLVAIAKGLVMNPNWVGLARNGRIDQIVTILDPQCIKNLEIPEGLWEVIRSSGEWFNIADDSKT